MKKTLTALAAVLLVLALGISCVLAAVLILPEQFDEHYLAALADKYARLRSLEDERKIIVIGGSSVAFGVNSQMIEENLGLPAVNMGLYGPLGITIMMDLTRGYVHEGDIVVLAPETDHQTMSMTFNGEAMWECCDSDFTMLFKIRYHNWGEMLGSFWPYAQKKLSAYRTEKIAPDGVYDHDSFNEYGDIVYPRLQPVMEQWYDPDVPIDLDPSIIDDDYLDYLNEYIAWCEKQGASVYFSWPPMDALGIVQEDAESVIAYATYVREHIDCPVISNITDYVMAPGYFYDTNYHVTDRGVIEHTARLIQDLNNVIGDGSLVQIEIPMPAIADNPGVSGEPLMPNRDPGSMPLPRGRNTDNAGQFLPGVPDGMPETPDGMLTPDTALTPDAAAEPVTTAAPTPTPVPTPEVVGSSRDAEYFLYDAYNEGLMITGVTDEGKELSTLEIPWLIDGQKVVAIGQYAFEGCANLTALYIQPNIVRIMQSAFDGAPRLTEIHIDNDSGANILIPGIGLFDNVPARLRVYVPSSAYGTFFADYFWGNYYDRLVSE